MDYGALQLKVSLQTTLTKTQFDFTSSIVNLLFNNNKDVGYCNLILIISQSKMFINCLIHPFIFSQISDSPSYNRKSGSHYCSTLINKALPSNANRSAPPRNQIDFSHIFIKPHYQPGCRHKSTYDVMNNELLNDVTRACKMAVICFFNGVSCQIDRTTDIVMRVARQFTWIKANVWIIIITINQQKFTARHRPPPQNDNTISLEPPSSTDFL